MYTPKNAWYVAARSDQLKPGEVIKRVIMETDIVLFRGEGGKVGALVDKCPHKHLPLSLGKVKGNNLTCRYHGWAFDETGTLKDIPCKGETEKLMACQVSRYPSIEQDDWIWVWTDLESQPDTSPPKYSKASDYYWFELHNVMQAPMDLVLENGLDCSHTGFVHEGLFRSEPNQYIEAVIEKTKTGVKVETLGEQNSDKKDVRSVLSGGNEITHIDEYLAPHTVKVDYTMGTSHVVTILVCTPETKERTRVYTRMGVKFPYFNRLIGKYVERTTKKVVPQDKVVLEAQAKNVPWGMRKGFRFSTADAPTRSFFKAFDQVCEGTPLWNGEFKKTHVRYKL